MIQLNYMRRTNIIVQRKQCFPSLGKWADFREMRISAFQ